jgi:oligopeptidase B
MKARIKEKDQSVPVFDNGYYYYTRYEEGKQYAIHCRKKGSLDAPEIILLDQNAMAEGHPYFDAEGFKVSPDNKLIAFAIDTLFASSVYYLY